MEDDSELLRLYAEKKDEAAFTAIVQRHIGLVYNAALRQVGGDHHLASDISQSVFTDLARKAAFLARREVLASWLFKSTRYAALSARRSNARRQRREAAAEATPMNESTSEMTPQWEQLRPFIDETISELGEADRQAVLLRYFEARDFASIAAQLGVKEDAARMRVDRALEKLRVRLARKGIPSVSAALAACLSAGAAPAVPAVVTASITKGALAAAGATVATNATIVFLSGWKLTALSVGSAAALTAVNVVQYRENAALLREVESSSTALRDLSSLQQENQRLRRELRIPEPHELEGTGTPPWQRVRTKGGYMVVGGKYVYPDMPPEERLELLRPGGMSTPSRAIQTIMDPMLRNPELADFYGDLMPSLICLDPDAQRHVQNFLTQLPSERAQSFAGPEALVAPVFLQWLKKDGEFSLYSPGRTEIAPGDPASARTTWETKRPTGEKELRTFPFKRFERGWKYGPLSGAEAEQLLALLDPSTGKPKAAAAVVPPTP